LEGGANTISVIQETKGDMVNSEGGFPESFGKQKASFIVTFLGNA
jgi:hypothetical protein